MAHLFQRSGVPLLRGQDVSPNRLDTTQPRYISAAVHALWKKSALSAGDVVLVRVGYPGTAAVVPEGLGDVNAASLVIVRPSPSKIRSDFLSIFVNSAIGKKQIEGLLVGGAQQVLNTSTAAQLTVPLPPMLEQEAIAGALSDADALIESLESLIAKKREIKQGAMQELLVGRKRLPGFSAEWETCRVAELEASKLVKLYRGQVISKVHIEATPGDFPIYSSSVHNEGLFGRYGIYMLDEELITWSIDGGGHFFYRPKHKFSVTNVCGYMRVDSSRANCRFLASALQLAHSTKNFDYQTKAHPSVVRKEYEIRWPALPEQCAIAAVLKDFDGELVTLEERLAKAHRIKQGMMQELLTGRVRLV